MKGCVVYKIVFTAAAVFTPLMTSANHLYTLSSTGELAPQNGYRLDGVAAFVFPIQVDGSIPIYRWYNPKRGAHFYTTDRAGEHASGMGYHAEPSPNTPVFYCYPASKDGTVSMTRWQHKKNIKHFYTTDPNGEHAGIDGYEREGDLCHVHHVSKPVPGTVPLYRWFKGNGKGPAAKSCWTTEYDDTTKSYRSYNKC